MSPPQSDRPPSVGLRRSLAVLAILGRHLWPKNEWGLRSRVLVAVVLLLLASPLVVAILRANELFVVNIEQGEARLVRGRVPPRLLADVGDVVRSVERARLHCVNEGGKPALYSEGTLSPAEKQRLRNVVGAWTVAQIRAGARKR